VNERTTRFARAAGNYENKQQQQQKQANSESLTHTSKFSLSRKTKKYQKKMLYIPPSLPFLPVEGKQASSVFPFCVL